MEELYILEIKNIFKRIDYKQYILPLEVKDVRFKIKDENTKRFEDTPYLIHLKIGDKYLTVIRGENFELFGNSYKATGIGGNGKTVFYINIICEDLESTGLFLDIRPFGNKNLLKLL
jgi:hypothetical protein